MLADLWITGYSSTNLVKDSTKSSPTKVFLPPSERGGAQLKLSLARRGCLKDVSYLSLLSVKLSGLAKRKRAVSCTGTMEKRGSQAVV